MNADQHTPIDRTDKLLQRMTREGYIVRTRESDGGEEHIEYLVGPRGKIEVGTKGVAGLVREVYGRADSGRANGHDHGHGHGDEDDDGDVGELAQLQAEEREIFESRLKRSLGIRDIPGQTQSVEVNGHPAGEEEAEEEASSRRQSDPRRSRRSMPATQRDEESSEEEEEESESDED